MRFPHLPTLVKSVLSLVPKANANNDNENSAALDFATLGQFHSGQVVCAVGTPTGSPTAFSVVYKLQDSPDGTTWTDIAGATVTIDAADTFKVIEFAPNEQEIQVRANRVVSTTGGSSPKVPNVAVVQLGAGRHIPAP